VEYLYSIIILIGLYIILSSSFDLILGYGGLFSVAHPIFFALGGYCSALLSMHFGIPIILSMILGGLFAALASVGLSIPALRVSGDYLMILSIGFQLGVLQVIKNIDLTGGHSGLSNIPSLFSGAARSPIFACLVLLVALVVVFSLRWLIKGDYGRAIQAMQDDEIAFVGLGRNSMNIKITILGVASGLAGVAGGLYAHHFQFLCPDQFEILQSAAIVTMVVVGGSASTWGPVLGAALLLALPQAIKFLNLPPSVNAPIQGMMFTVLVLVFLFVRPQGIISAQHDRIKQSTKHQTGDVDVGEPKGKPA